MTHCLISVSSILFALAFSTAFYRWLYSRPHLAETRLAGEIPTWRMVLAEGKTTLLALLVLNAVYLVQLHFNQGFLKFSSPTQVNFVNTVVAFLALFWVHDFWFFFTHWLMHKVRFLRPIHRHHHTFVNPTPFCSMAFDVREILLIAIPTSLLSAFIEVNILTLLAFFSFMYAHSCYAHCGFELIPQSILRSKWGYLINSASAHHAHHRGRPGNYGMFTLVWDHLFGTANLPTVSKKEAENTTSSKTLLKHVS